MRNRTDDAADHRSAENGPSVRLMVMFDVNNVRRRRGRQRGRRRRCWMPHGCRVVSRCAVVGDLMAVCLARFRRGCLLLCRCLLVRGGGTLATPGSGSRQRRTANRHTRECRDCHLDDLLVHVTPTFPGFLPLHKARRGTGSFLTEIFIEKILSEIPLIISFQWAGALFAPGKERP